MTRQITTRPSPRAHPSVQHTRTHTHTHTHTHTQKPLVTHMTNTHTHTHTHTQYGQRLYSFMTPKCIAQGRLLWRDYSRPATQIETPQQLSAISPHSESLECVLTNDASLRDCWTTGKYLTASLMLEMCYLFFYFIFYDGTLNYTMSTEGVIGAINTA